LPDQFREGLTFGSNQFGDAITVHVRHDDLADLGPDDREDAQLLHSLRL
jgi:hypothetical protein